MEIAGKDLDTILEIKIGSVEVQYPGREKLSLEDRWQKAVKETERKMKGEKNGHPLRNR